MSVEITKRLMCDNCQAAFRHALGDEWRFGFSTPNSEIRATAYGAGWRRSFDGQRQKDYCGECVAALGGDLR